MGKCPGCGAWDSFIEAKEEKKRKISSKSKILKLDEIEKEEIQRFSTGNSELDLVLGGGVVPGELVLIGGSPGVGKSTLMLKLAGNIDKKVLYIAGEESPSQIKLRAERLNLKNKNLFIMPEIVLENFIDEIKNYDLVIIDSIQTIYSNEIQSAPGSVSQVRNATFELMRVAKENKIPIFIVGHITKEGSIAGPRVLEHMVDCVLYFEGEISNEIRILRAFKNRFGSTSEIGIFEMKNSGLEVAKNRLFFDKKPTPGSVVSVILEGSRPIILEVQALVSESYSIPKRSATGFDINRLNMILALLEKKLNIPLNRYDVFINVAGGIKITETGADLAIIMAIVSSFKNRPISKESIFIGEVSLVGDIREVAGIEQRLKEAANLGFKKAIIPSKINLPGIKTYEVKEVEKLFEWL
jgi:DNA repair protein RadA/Sms